MRANAMPSHSRNPPQLFQATIRVRQDKLSQCGVNMSGLKSWPLAHKSNAIIA